LAIQGASVSLDKNATRATDANGRVVYYPVAVGAYTVFASGAGYTSNSTGTGPIGNNQTIDVSLCLNPLPCMVTVTTVLASDNSLLPGVLVSLGSVLLGTQTTALPSSAVSWNITSGSATLATGSISGYSTEQGSFTCAQGGTATVTLRFTPLPNIIRVVVRDIRTDLPITFARVNLTVTAFGTQSVDGNARTVFSPVAAGTYTASASATGYSSNSTVAGPVTRNQTIEVIIYLRELPCVIQVNVVSNNTGLVIPAAAVSLNYPNTTTLSNAQGIVTYSAQFDFVASPVASASKSGYRDGSTPFTCSRGAFVNVTVLLNEVLEITLAAIDALTSSKPYLEFAKIYFNDVLVTKLDPQNKNLRLYAVDSLPVRGVVKGTAGGFNDKVSDPITFTLTNRAFNISLAPQEFVIYFVPAEVLTNGSLARVSELGLIPNNFESTTSSDTASIWYTPNSITAGGSATQLSDPPTSQSFVATTQIIFTDPANVDRNTYAFAATFPSLLPSSQIPFTLQVKDLDTLKANAPGNVSSLDVPIPEFASQIERTIIYDIPMKLGAAYFNIRVTSMLPSFALRTFSSGDFCFARVTLKKAIKYTNYDKVLGFSQRAVFESYITFGDEVTKIEIGYPSESYNTTLSNWADTESSPFPNVRPFKPTDTVPAELNKFLWPPSKLLSNLFTPLTATKQQGRNPNALLYFLQDYVLIYTPRTKRSEEN